MAEAQSHTESDKFDNGQGPNNRVKSMTSTPDPRTGLRRTTRSTLSGWRHLSYDLKYHPMDDTLKPKRAEKRRRAHTDEGSVAEEDDDDKEDSVSNNNHRRRLSTSTSTRRSIRRSSQSHPSYDASIHPQDKALREASILSGPRAYKSADNERDKHGASMEHDQTNSVITPCSTSPQRTRHRNETQKRSRILKLDTLASQYTAAWESLAEHEQPEEKIDRLAIVYSQAWEACATERDVFRRAAEKSKKLAVAGNIDWDANEGLDPTGSQDCQDDASDQSEESFQTQIGVQPTIMSSDTCIPPPYLKSPTRIYEKRKCNASLPNISIHNDPPGLLATPSPTQMNRKNAGLRHHFHDHPKENEGQSYT